MIYHGSNANEHSYKRGKGGVGIALSSLAEQAWKSAGSVVHKEFGDRILAITLLVKDLTNRDIGIYLVSAYAPIGNADQRTWDNFLANLEKCIDNKPKNDILVIGCDCNSSLGTHLGKRVGNCMQSVGPFGLHHRNRSGIRLLTFLEINSLVATTTYFRKKNYVTWRHPRSNLLHQIDYFRQKRISVVSSIPEQSNHL